MSIIRNKRNLSLVLIFSIFALIAAFFIEYIMGHQPCNLCLFERIPYVLVIIIVSFFFLLKKYERLCLIIISIIFFFATLLSFYHFGIEQGFIEESFVCELNEGDKILNAEELLNKLNEKTVSCKEVTFKIIGLSLATINTIISFVLSVIFFKLYMNYEKNK